MLQAHIREKLEKRNRLIQDGRDLYAKVEQEKRSLTDEERKNDEARLKEIMDLGEDVKRLERQVELEREQAASATRHAPEQTRETGQAADRAHRSRLIEHCSRLSRLMSVTGDGAQATVSFADPLLDARAALSYHQEYEQFLRGQSFDKRALQADVAISGGYLVAPMQMVTSLIQAIDDLVFVRKYGTKHLVVNADGIGMPSLDADPADSDWTSELATGSEDSTMAFGRRELKPYPLAKLIKVSNKLIRTSAQDAESLVRQRLAYKFGISEEKAFLLGTGANQPLGVFTASNDGIPTSRDVATGSATDFTMDGIYDAKYTLKGGYWNRPSTAWMFHRDGLKKIAKLKDSQNRYLWEPSQQAGQPDMLLGIPVAMSEYVPNTFTTGLYVGMLADWSYYHIADSLNLTVQRLVELYAATNQIGFIGRQEVDGMPVLGEAFVRLKTS